MIIYIPYIVADTGFRRNFWEDDMDDADADTCQFTAFIFE